LSDWQQGRVGVFGGVQMPGRRRAPPCSRVCPAITAPAPARPQVAAAIGGGYAEDHSLLVERHVSLHRAAAEAWPALAAAAEARRAAARAARQARR
jgi:hypothetical protein